MLPGTGLQYFILFMMFYKKTYKKEKPKMKRDASAEDLLEELGDTVEIVRRGSIKVVERVRRNSVTALGNLRQTCQQCLTMFGISGAIYAMATVAMAMYGILIVQKQVTLCHQTGDIALRQKTDENGKKLPLSAKKSE